MTTGNHRFRSLGLYALSWIEYFLVHGPGDVQGQPIELDDEFSEFTLRAYELDEHGNRKVRRAFLSRSKGRNKSGFAAMVECFEALGECRFDHWAEPGEISDWGYVYEPGDPVGRQLGYVECLNVATEEGQAGNTYDAVYYMLHSETCSQNLLDWFGSIDTGLTRINLPYSRGFIEPVTASNESKDGGKSTFIVADETHLWTPPAAGVFKLGKMHQTMVRNLLKRKQSSGWMLETSTMYAEGENSVAEGTHAYAKALADGSKSGKLLFDHRQASDHWNLDDRAERIEALGEAYGPAASWMDLEGIADYWDDPQASEAEFRRFWLNQPVPLQDTTVFDVLAWSHLVDTDASVPDRVSLVIDVSPDMRSATLGVAGDCGGKTLVMSMQERGTAWVVPKVVELQSAKSIDEIFLVTSGQARSLQPELTTAGVEFEKLSQVDVSASCVAFQRAVKHGTVVHVGQPELDAAVAVARTRKLGESEVWDRDKQSVDISPLVACAAAFYRWGLQPAAPLIF